MEGPGDPVWPFSFVQEVSMERKEKSQSQSATAEPLEALLQAVLARWQHAVDQDMPIVGAEAVEWLSEFIREARRLLPHLPYTLENHQSRREHHA